jgi:hypothetical protein
MWAQSHSSSPRLDGGLEPFRSPKGRPPPVLRTSGSRLTLGYYVIPLIGATQMNDQNDSEEFRRFARECMQLAEQVQSVHDKATLLRMAQVWIRLADQGHQVRQLVDGDGPQRSLD